MRELAPPQFPGETVIAFEFFEAEFKLNYTFAFTSHLPG
jgi:hypothetical protein